MVATPDIDLLPPELLEKIFHGLCDLGKDDSIRFYHMC
jgi:hypothetical protein